MKKLLVACVATFAFIGMQNSLVMAKENNPIEEKVEETKEVITGMLEVSSTHTDNPNKQISEDLLKEKIEPSVLISPEEKELLSRLVEAEAKGESFEGKVAVAEVVLNRVDSPEFPNTITNVIYEVVGNAYAFSPVQNGEIKKPASEEAKKAVDNAISSKDRLQNALYFYNPDIATDNWIRSRKVVKSIDNHVFAI